MLQSWSAGQSPVRSHSWPHQAYCCLYRSLADASWRRLRESAPACQVRAHLSMDCRGPLHCSGRLLDSPVQCRMTAA